MHCELLLCQLLFGTPTASNACLCGVQSELPPLVLTSESLCLVPCQRLAMAPASEHQLSSGCKGAASAWLCFAQEVCSTSRLSRCSAYSPLWLPEVGSMLPSALHHHDVQQHAQKLKRRDRQALMSASA